MSKRAVAALFLSQMLAGVAFAQSVVPPAGATDPSVAAPYEFGRAFGGEMDLITKRSSGLSGSLGFSMSKAPIPFATGGNGTTKGLDATLGGTLVKDKVWFFASAHQNDALLTSRYGTVLTQNGTSNGAVSRGIDTKLTAQIGDRNNLAASFAAGRELGVTPAGTVAPTPASFLALRYTGVVSSNMFFSTSFSRYNAQSESPFATVVQPR
jgi:hypothetical protein